MCQTSLIQTSCLALLKAIYYLGKLDGGIVRPHWAMLYALLFCVDESPKYELERCHYQSNKNFDFGALTLVCILCLCVFIFSLPWSIRKCICFTSSWVRLRLSRQFDIYYQYFRPVGDFTFLWMAKRKVSKGKANRAFSDPNNKWLL